ncbi:hypothetical protein EOK75_06860 [Pseudorhodobacter turbinis]|uniref:Uncharacterized protein n=1 Tax=Pseudorhodobacter turbinis TaxID=2500533 RepID=A0A4P8EFC3_9RHOB|nr:hypothetical protein [Pseudorhodobacter turbinis]QCO55497.1 hypothetical protein EOK75_06860 [Pseudorhodobacter turbinis]
MQLFAILSALLLSGCASLIANFEDDRVGSRPSVFPTGYPDDEIRFNSSFQGAVRGYPIADPTGLRNGQKSLEVIGNSSVSFLSEPISESQQASRHSVSFLFTDHTARGKSISFSQGNGTRVHFRLEGTQRQGRDEGEAGFSVALQSLGAS